MMILPIAHTPTEGISYFTPFATRTAAETLAEPVKRITSAVSKIITLRINGVCVKTVDQPLVRSLDLDAFQRKYLPGVTDTELDEISATDLWQEVEEKKISRIKYYRIINKLTQKDLAKKLNTKQPNVVRIEKVGYKPNLDTIKRLGGIFGIDYKELLE